MNFIYQLLVIPAITGLIFIPSGLIMLKFPPKKINALYGYRTSSSMKNQDRWDFAQKFSARQMLSKGGLLVLSSFLGLFLDLPEATDVAIGIFILLFWVTMLFFTTEKAIKSRFDKSPL